MHANNLRVVPSAGLMNKKFMARGLGAVGDTSSLDSGSGLDTTAITNLLQTGVTAWNTQQIIAANTARAAQGLPPLDASAYAPQVNVGLAPNTMLLIGGAILAGFLLLRR